MVEVQRFLNMLFTEQIKEVTPLYICYIICVFQFANIGHLIWDKLYNYALVVAITIVPGS